MQAFWEECSMIALRVIVLESEAYLPKGRDGKQKRKGAEKHDPHSRRNHALDTECLETEGSERATRPSGGRRRMKEDEEK